MLTGYLQLIAALSGGLIGVVDGSVSVRGTIIHGRFPLEIVLDCAALDVQLLFGVAVLLLRAPWRHRLRGLVLGLPIIAAANIARIVALYFVGAHAPSWFHTAHHEVFQLALILLTCALFAVWAFARPPVREAAHAGA